MVKPLVYPISAPERPTGLHSQTGTGLLVSAVLVVLILAGSRQDPTFGVFGALGVGFGIVLQRSRFCFTAAFRDLFQFRSGRTMKGVIVGMAVTTAGFGVHYILGGPAGTAAARRGSWTHNARRARSST